MGELKCDSEDPLQTWRDRSQILACLYHVHAAELRSMPDWQEYMQYHSEIIPVQVEACSECRSCGEPCQLSVTALMCLDLEEACTIYTYADTAFATTK